MWQGVISFSDGAFGIGLYLYSLLPKPQALGLGPGPRVKQNKPGRLTIGAGSVWSLVFGFSRPDECVEPEDLTLGEILASLAPVLDLVQRTLLGSRVGICAVHTMATIPCQL